MRYCTPDVVRTSERQSSHSTRQWDLFQVHIEGDPVSLPRMRKGKERAAPLPHALRKTIYFELDTKTRLREKVNYRV